MVSAVVSRKFRPSVAIPSELAESMDAAAERRGVTGATVCHYLIVTAAQAAAFGRGHLLPRARRMASGSLGETKDARWSQGRGDYSECVRLIEGAGSSVTAVLRAGGAMYVQHDGDLVRMPWLRTD